MCVGIETNHTYTHVLAFVHSGGTLLVPMFSYSRCAAVSFLCLSSPFKEVHPHFFPTHFVASFSPAEMTDIEKGGMKKSASYKTRSDREFPQCGRGFSVRTFVASFVLRVRL